MVVFTGYDSILVMATRAGMPFRMAVATGADMPLVMMMAARTGMFEFRVVFI